MYIALSQKFHKIIKLEKKINFKISKISKKKKIKINFKISQISKKKIFKFHKISKLH